MERKGLAGVRQEELLPIVYIALEQWLQCDVRLDAQQVSGDRYCDPGCSPVASVL